MRRALAKWASHALRGAHAEYVDSSAIRWLATSAKQNVAGKQEETRLPDVLKE